MAAIEELAPGTMPPVVLTQLEALLKRKLGNIPEHILPSFTIYDVLHRAPQMLVNPYVPTDIQLPFILRNHSSIDRDKGRPIKSERQQDLDTTRAIFFYHRHEAYQFQRYHDTSRWNLAFFTALLCDEPATPTSTSHDYSDDTDDSLHARTFMVSYLAAVMERHNTPTTFEKREDFVRHWKWSDWDLFTRFASGQKRVLKREMSRLTKEWGRELDKAKKEMGRDEYDLRVAPFVGSVIPGRKDQGLMHGVEHLQGWSISDSQSAEDVDVEVSRKKREELNGALCVPVEEERYGDDEDYGDDGTTPTDLSDAITWMQSTRPADMLPVLMRLFPVEE